MRYIALLRGINVGGSNKVSMDELRASFESARMTSVRTYINSGNVAFDTEAADRADVVRRLEDTLRERTGVAADVQLRDADEIAAIVAAIPDDWTDGPSMKCDVVFLQPDVDDPGILAELGPRPGIEDAIYVPGAVIWRIDRANATRNRLTRITGTPLYRRVTVRNCNTARKLLELARG